MSAEELNNRINMPVLYVFIASSVLWLGMTFKGVAPPPMVVQTIVISLGLMFAKKGPSTGQNVTGNKNEA